MLQHRPRSRMSIRPPQSGQRTKCSKFVFRLAAHAFADMLPAPDFWRRALALMRVANVGPTHGVSS
jgi:hypothetical protein